MDVSKIDFSKAPEGATHYAGNADGSPVLVFYRKLGQNWSYIYHDAAQIWAPCTDNEPALQPIEIPKWSIYNNTKPFGELTDEQCGKLRRAHDSGKTVQSLDDDGYAFQDCGLPSWVSCGVCRIKQKSDREVFAEAAAECRGESSTLTEGQMTMAAYQLFDSGKFKCIKDGE